MTVGEKIESLDELEKQEFIFYNGKLLNHKYFQNWQIRFAVKALQDGSVYEARGQP